VKIVFDIVHPADVNFFRNLMTRFMNEGHRVTIICLRRGRLPEIVSRELATVPVVHVGRYGRSSLGLILRTGLARQLLLVPALLALRPDVTIGFGAFQTAVLARIFRFRSIGAYDDPEYRLLFRLCKTFFHRLAVPACVAPEGDNVVPFKGLKEWAYLSPAYFQPDPSVLAQYGLEPMGYVFIRDVALVSLNYRSQRTHPVSELYRSGLDRERVVLSLEDRRQRDQYKAWTVLDEPVQDIHSLIYYSKAVISSGDTVAREAAVLGVPAIYCGERIMRANSELMRLGLLHHIREARGVLEFLRRAAQEGSVHRRQAVREQLAAEWEDPNQVLYELVVQGSGRDKGPRVRV